MSRYPIRANAHHASRSTVATSAYQAAEVLRDERSGSVFDFRYRRDVAHAQLLLPASASAPIGERERLWNAVEEAAAGRAHHRKALWLSLRLPPHISLGSQLRLACAFADEHFTSAGRAVDLAVHRDEEGSAHLHLMITRRVLDGERLRLPSAPRFGDAVDFLHWQRAWQLGCARLDHAQLLRAQTRRDAFLDAPLAAS